MVMVSSGKTFGRKESKGLPNLMQNPSQKGIKRMTRKKYSAEGKISIVLEGLRGEEGIATICRLESISPNLYYRWSKELLEAGTKTFAW